MLASPAEVLKWSDASYLEDQDHWWLAGLPRSVYLYSHGPTYLCDVWSKGGLDANGEDGVLEVDALLGLDGKAQEGWSISVQLYDSRKKRVFRLALRVKCDVTKEVKYGAEGVEDPRRSPR